ncbi:hypothetical protein K505DRAFT_2325 [Melanomma pulvis-pyrius CBS 109.77]|uniref:Uncharacterized protein n=1 Tax=Melanomma pulvis-pyrius CBS 109.77 TaxID=1314802 RepID=A0A6A6XIH6_9PLEO|nr:hypothetical protein K505DRAFT_2325 [Melanomma pulvis-pyrius CBS 109.77]
MAHAIISARNAVVPHSTHVHPEVPTRIPGPSCLPCPALLHTPILSLSLVLVPALAVLVCTQHLGYLPYSNSRKHARTHALMHGCTDARHVFNCRRTYAGGTPFLVSFYSRVCILLYIHILIHTYMHTYIHTSIHTWRYNTIPHRPTPSHPNPRLRSTRTTRT